MSETIHSGSLREFSLTPAQDWLPPFSMGGKRVLDIGCANGKDLTHEMYANAQERCGVDLDANAIEAGRRMFPSLDLRVTSAERLPFPDGYFDVVTSRVALPYVNIPLALSEISRVLRANGYIYLTLHDFKLQLRWTMKAAKSLAWKRVIDFSYVTVASVSYALLDFVPARPWKGTRETFQFCNPMCRSLQRLGFKEITVEKARYFSVTATKG
ncbi:MAG: class I SAM-dependent methyltransferase [Steroidobacteraceae bacterium]